MRRPREDGEALRERIIAEAAAILVAEGEAGLSMRVLAARVGYSPTTLYRRFADKEAVLVGVLDEALLRFEAALKAAATSPRPADRLEAIGRAYLAFARQNPALYRVMFEVLPVRMSEPSPAGSPRAAAFAVLADTVAWAFPDSADLAGVTDALWCLVHGLFDLGAHGLLDSGRLSKADDAAFALVRAALADLVRSTDRGPVGGATRG